MYILVLSALVNTGTCVSGDPDICQDSKAVDLVLDECDFQLDQHITDNYTADCSNGIVQQYIDCLHEIGSCIELMSTVQGSLAEAYGFETNFEILSETKRKARGCYYYCYPSKYPC